MNVGDDWVRRTECVHCYVQQSVTKQVHRFAFLKPSFLPFVLSFCPPTTAPDHAIFYTHTSFSTLDAEWKSYSFAILPSRIARTLNNSVWREVCAIVGSVVYWLEEFQGRSNLPCRRRTRLKYPILHRVASRYSCFFGLSFWQFDNWQFKSAGSRGGLLRRLSSADKEGSGKTLYLPNLSLESVVFWAALYSTQKHTHHGWTILLFYDVD